MDQNKLLEIASYVTNLKMFPYFDAAHYVVMCLMVRDDSGAAEHSGMFRGRYHIGLNRTASDHIWYPHLTKSD